MNEKLLLTYINLDDYDLNTFKEDFFQIELRIISELEKNNAWKSIIVVHSKLLFNEIKKLYEIMLNYRINDRIVFGSVKTNDLDCYYYNYFLLTNGLDERKTRIFKETYNHYKDIMPIEKVLIYDKKVNIPDETLSQIFDVEYEIVFSKPNRLLMQKQ